MADLTPAGRDAVTLPDMQRPLIVIVTPALAAANNGNWQTANRWAHMLSRHFDVRLVDRWEAGDERAMISLHARRSADSVAAWRQAHPDRPLVVVLTGTDLYRDIAYNPVAQRSLDLADRLVVLQPLGVAQLPAPLRSKATVCIQSSPARRPLARTTRHLRALMVGHLREEKSPTTYFDAARALRRRTDILLDHIGAPLDASLGEQAQALAAECPHYRWLGALPHQATRRRIQAAHVLVHASRMEGGAHVVIEAVTAGTPVIASRIDGNVGLLGDDYEGYFPWGDVPALVSLLERCRDEPAMLGRLREQCERVAPGFHPDREAQTLNTLMSGLMSEFMN
jgi:putative glycosyltransferase (TIGR04348 family)